MKLKLTTIAALSVAVFSVQAQSIVTITESDETLSATLDGQPFGAIIEQIPNQGEAWLVTLPVGYSFSPTLINQGLLLLEPPGESGYNVITVQPPPPAASQLPPNSLTWLSDLPIISTADVKSSVASLEAAGLTPNGFFNLVLVDQAETVPGVPDGGSTIVLLSVGLFGIAAARAKLRK